MAGREATITAPVTKTEKGALHTFVKNFTYHVVTKQRKPGAGHEKVTVEFCAR